MRWQMCHALGGNIRAYYVAKLKVYLKRWSIRMQIYFLSPLILGCLTSFCPDFLSQHIQNICHCSFCHAFLFYLYQNASLLQPYRVSPPEPRMGGLPFLDKQETFRKSFFIGDKSSTVIYACLIGISEEQSFFA